MKKHYSYAHLPKAVYLLFVSDIILTSGKFIFPFLSLILIQNYGISQQMAGVFMMAATVSSIVGTWLGGIFADHFQRKTVLLVAMAGGSVAYLLALFMTNPYLAGILILVGLGYMASTKPAFNAMVTDVTLSSQRQSAFSLLYLGVNIGFSVAPLIGSFIYQKDYHFLFIGEAAAILLSALFIFFSSDSFPPEHEKEEEISLSKLRKDLRQLFTLLGGQPGHLLIGIAYALLMIAYSQIFFTMPLQLSGLFHESGIRYYGIMMTLNGFSVILLSSLVTKATRNRKPSANMVLAGLVFAFGLGAYSITDKPCYFMAWVFVWSIGEILTNTNLKVYYSEYAAPRLRAKFHMVGELAYEAGFGLGPFMAGFVIACGKVRALWVGIFFLCLFSSYLAWRAGKIRKEEKSGQHNHSSRKVYTT